MSDRKIKFRVYVKTLTDGEYMLQPPKLISFGGSGELSWVTASDETIYKDNGLSERHAMQFTGLFDKNGREIYEGDIIDNPGYGITDVKFMDGVFCASRGEEWGKIDEDCEVISNIYEKPELLK